MRAGIFNFDLSNNSADEYGKDDNDDENNDILFYHNKQQTNTHQGEKKKNLPFQTSLGRDFVALFAN